MNTLIILGLAAFALTTIARMSMSPPIPPQIIVVQSAPVDPSGGTGCLPLLVLVGVILLAITFA